jgi:hypothetical protein
MVGTAYFDLTDAVVALFGGNNTIVQAGQVSYTVYDGMPTSENYPDDVVIVGWDADPEGNFQSAVVNQDWASIGQGRRDEQVKIPCAVISHYGNGDSWKPCRDFAKAVLTDVETKLRDNPDLGLAIDGVRQVITAEFKPTGMYQEPYGETGFWFRAAFAIRVTTRV